MNDERPFKGLDIETLQKLKLEKEIYLINKEIKAKNKKPNVIQQTFSFIKKYITEISAITGALVVIFGPINTYYQNKRKESQLNFDSKFLSILKEYQSAKFNSQKNRDLYILSSYDQKDLIPFLLNEININDEPFDSGQINTEDIIKAIKYKIESCKSSEDTKQIDRIYTTIHDKLKQNLDQLINNTNKLGKEEYRNNVEKNLKLLDTFKDHPKISDLLNKSCEFISNLDTVQYEAARFQFKNYCKKNKAQ